jgi:hypothetical protein
MRLLSSDYWLMDESGYERVVVLRRTAIPFASVEAIARATEVVKSKLQPYHRRFGVVADLRLAPPRNDAAFEAATRGFRAALEAHFARVAVLLQTPVGVLQVNRVKRDEGSALFFVTMNEDEAMLFARGPSSSPPKLNY